MRSSNVSALIPIGTEHELAIGAAPGEATLCEAFVSCHRSVLEEMGLPSEGPRPRWEDDPLSYLIVVRARKRGAEPVAGGRVHVRSGDNRISLEDILETVAPAVIGEIRARSAMTPVAEFSNLWVLDSHRGLSFGHSIIAGGVALCGRLQVRTGIVLASPHVRRTMHGFGFRVDTRVGLDGSFPYPDARYQSSIMWADPLALEAMSVKRAQMVASFESTEGCWMRHADIVR